MYLLLINSNFGSVTSNAGFFFFLFLFLLKNFNDSGFLFLKQCIQNLKIRQSAYKINS